MKNMTNQTSEILGLAIDSYKDLTIIIYFLFEKSLTDIFPNKLFLIFPDRNTQTLSFPADKKLTHEEFSLVPWKHMSARVSSQTKAKGKKYLSAFGRQRFHSFRVCLANRSVQLILFSVEFEVWGAARSSLFLSQNYRVNYYESLLLIGVISRECFFAVFVSVDIERKSLSRCQIFRVNNRCQSRRRLNFATNLLGNCQ